MGSELRPVCERHKGMVSKDGFSGSPVAQQPPTTFGKERGTLDCHSDSSCAMWLKILPKIGAFSALPDLLACLTPPVFCPVLITIYGDTALCVSVYLSCLPIDY